MANAAAEPIVLASVTDRHHLPYLEVVAASVAEFAAPDRPIAYHVFYDGPPDPRAERLAAYAPGTLRIVLHRIANPFADLAGAAMVPPIAYVRLLLPDLLPDEHRLVYLDTDVMALADIGPLFDVDLESSALGAVVDLQLRLLARPGDRLFGFNGSTAEYLASVVGLDDKAAPRYVNSGVLVMDLERLRATDFVAASSAVARQNADRFLWADQDVINQLMHQQIKFLDPSWNVLVGVLLGGSLETLAPGERAAVEHQRRAPRIVHFTAVNKPWLRTRLLPHANLWWNFASSVPAADEIAASYRATLASQGKRVSPLHGARRLLAGAKLRRTRR